MATTLGGRVRAGLRVLAGTRHPVLFAEACRGGGDVRSPPPAPCLTEPTIYDAGDITSIAESRSLAPPTPSVSATTAWPDS
jgi:hypothetical protein